MKIITVEDVAEILDRHSFDTYIEDLMSALRRDFGRWQEFNKIPRPAMHVVGGVLELMPICDNTYYSYKYVNCHPKNPEIGKMTVVATGQLARIDTGYPVMVSEMTLLTALRTAATSALATDLMARKDAHIAAIIGTGAQSEFQIRSLAQVRDISEVRYFDIDDVAMDKFERNMQGNAFKLVRAKSAEAAVSGADIVTVVTACRQHVDVIKNDWITDGMHINALGGDCRGKTELELDIVLRSRTVVEYFDQSIVEGEIQRLTKAEARNHVHAEMHELVNGHKKGRHDDSDITLFDSVGTALEDYSVLRLTYELANRYGVGQDANLMPNIRDPKDLVSQALVARSTLTERGK